jgi:hypothetical protein
MGKDEPTGARVWKSKTGDYWIDIRLLPNKELVSLNPEDAERIMNAIQRCLWEIETEETNRQLGIKPKEP